MRYSIHDLRRRALTSVAVLAISGCVALPALAQDRAAGSGNDTGGLEEIVVTAQHREERMQDVPIAVSAVTSNTLLDSGVGTSSALPQIVPSVQFTRSGPSGLFFVRGVGQTNAATGEEGSNAFYVDGVYMADLGQTVNYFNNIDRIEVLKGPQGTLFGRNATGGLIHVITREPGDETVVKAQAGYGNFKTFNGQFYGATALSQNLSWDIAVTGQNQSDGWGHNRTLNKENALEDYFGVRSKGVFRPADSVKIILAGDYFYDSDSTSLAFDLDPNQVGTGGTRYVPGRDNNSDLSPNTKRKIGGASLTVEADLGIANLTSISAYRNNTTRSVIDTDGAALPVVGIQLRSRTQAYTQELRLASIATEPFSWQAGAFFLHSKATNFQRQSGTAFGAAFANATAVLIDDQQITDSYAAFGELTYAITPSTHLTAGIRYTHDKRKFGGGRSAVSAAGIVGPQSVQPNPNLSYDKFTYRVALRQDLSDDVNVYASVNRGFKAGMFSLQGPLDAPVKPQYIMAYEVGLKSELFDRRLRLNLAAYHYDIDDLQIRSGAGANPGTSILLNAAKVKVDGLEAEFEAQPTEHLHLFGGFNWLKSVYDKFGGPGAGVQAPFSYPRYAPVATTCPASQVGTANPGSIGSGTLSGGLLTCFGDAAGNRTALAPKFAASFGGTYTVPVSNTGEVRFTALYSYNSGYVYEPDNFYGQKAFSLINGSIEYKINENYSIELWGKNLGNKTYYAQELSSGTGTTTILAPPRTYGINAKLNF